MIKSHFGFRIFLLLLACLVAGLLAINIGPERVTLFSGALSPTTVHAILFDTRLPRVCLALLVGAALGSTGVAYQALLRNPLADPYILGVSGGAALGSALAIAARWPFTGIVATAFGMSCAAMFVIFRAAARPGRAYAHALLLTGVVFNAFAFACIMLIHAVVPMERAHAILLLLMGNLTFGDGRMTLAMAAAFAAGFLLLVRRARAMDALVLGEETAASLGIPLKRFQAEVFFAGSLIIGAAVAVSGLIGFVGLFVPHAVRLVTRADHRVVLPLSALTGALFLLVADTIARTVLSGAALQTELPVGVITALVGAPGFIYLLRRQLV